MVFLRKHPQGILFKVLVQPRSSKNMIVGLQADSIKIKVTAPPVDGAANKSCIKFLAKCLSVAPSALEIISGHHGRMKTLLLKSQKTPPSAADYTHLKKRIDRLMNSTL